MVQAGYRAGALSAPEGPGTAGSRASFRPSFVRNCFVPRNNSHTESSEFDSAMVDYDPKHGRKSLRLELRKRRHGRIRGGINGHRRVGGRYGRSCRDGWWWLGGGRLLSAAAATSLPIPSTAVVQMLGTANHPEPLRNAAWALRALLLLPTSRLRETSNSSSPVSALSRC